MRRLISRKSFLPTSPSSSQLRPPVSQRRTRTPMLPSEALPDTFSLERSVAPSSRWRTRHFIRRLTKLIAEEWNALSDKKKKPYLDMAAKDKLRYEKEKKDTRVARLMQVELAIARRSPSLEARQSQRSLLSRRMRARISRRRRRQQSPRPRQRRPTRKSQTRSSTRRSLRKRSQQLSRKREMLTTRR